MITWMTITDLSEYIKIPESKIRSFMKNKQIPFYDNHGFLRFHRLEIDEWMKKPSSAMISKEEQGTVYEKGMKEEKDEVDMIKQISYRGKIMNDYVLTATIIFAGVNAWKHLTDFITRTMRAIEDVKLHEHGREYLYREEFLPFINNYYDYLRVCCQIGLIDNKQGIKRKKFYYPTEYAEKMAKKPHQATEIIIESIFNIARKKLETFPDERHSMLLLWYLLLLKEKGIKADEKLFKMDKDKNNNYFPLIRLNFTKSFCEFLFNNDQIKEQSFLKEWKKLI